LNTNLSKNLLFRLLPLQSLALEGHFTSSTSGGISSRVSKYERLNFEYKKTKYFGIFLIVMMITVSAKKKLN
jgi:hypothetical protein